MSRFYDEIDNLIEELEKIEIYINENFTYDNNRVKIVKDWNPRKSKFTFVIKIEEIKAKKKRKCF